MKYSLFAALLCGAVLASCSSESHGDPKEAYSNLVSAAQKGDGGKMYDYLDTTFRGQVDQMIDMQMKNKDRMPPEERAKWEQMSGLKGRDAFAKMVTLNKEMMTARFQGDYKILKTDTLVVLTVQHASQPADIMFMRYQQGAWRVTAPPSPPQPQMPEGHPQMDPNANPHGQMSPEGAAPNAGAPEGAAPNSGAPNGSAEGSTQTPPPSEKK